MGFAFVLPRCGDQVLERVGYDGPGDSHGRIPAGRTVTTLMISSAVCALMMLADLRHAARSAAAAKLTGSGSSRPRAQA